MNDTILEVVNLTKSFNNTIAVDNISFKVYTGDIYGFLGPNGSGKTTTLRMILNLIKPNSGHIKICGYDVKKDFKNSIKNIGAIIETPIFYSYLSGEENLNLMARLSKISYSKVEDVLKLVGLYSNKDKKFSNYSLGMKQRLGIANALLTDPSIVILDEPTNGLDPQGIKEIRELIVKLSVENNITFIISTHLLYEVEQICNRVGILKNGKLITEGDVNSLISSDTEDILLQTSTVELASRVLKDIDYIHSYREDGKDISINISKGHTSKLIEKLINSKVAVEYVIPLKTSLEDVFIDLTKGDSIND